MEWLLSIGVYCFFVWIFGGYDGGKVTPPPPEQPHEQPETPKDQITLPPGCYRVYDADTIYADIPGFPRPDKKQWRIRFAGIDAPELSTDIGKEAAAFVRGLTEGADVVVRDVKPEKYGILARVSVHGRDLSEELKAKGFALDYNGRGQKPVHSKPVQERRARVV